MLLCKWDWVWCLGSVVVAHYSIYDFHVPSFSYVKVHISCVICNANGQCFFRLFACVWIRWTKKVKCCRERAKKKRMLAGSNFNRIRSAMNDHKITMVKKHANETESTISFTTQHLIAENERSLSGKWWDLIHTIQPKKQPQQQYKTRKKIH